MKKFKFIDFNINNNQNISLNEIDFNYNNFTININNIKTKNSNEINFDFYNKNQFNSKHLNNINNLNVSNKIRNSESSRNNTKEYKESKESLQMFDYQFKFLNKEFKNPIMDIPRGGIMTRKNYIINNINNNIKFEY